MVCCEGPGRACSPVSEKPLADGSPCQSGVCRAVSAVTTPPPPLYTLLCPSLTLCVQGECSPLTQDQIARIWTIIVTLNGSALRKQGLAKHAYLIRFSWYPLRYFPTVQFINENIVGFTLIFSIPVWCIGSCLLYWLVSDEEMIAFNP